MKKGPLDMVKLLNEKSRRDAVTAGVMGGKTILHYAAYNNPECIPYFLRIYPELVRARDALGQLPLHVALMCDCSLAALKVLHRAAKDTAVAKDDHWGNTPLVSLSLYTLKVQTNDDFKYSILTILKAYYEH